MERSEGPGAHGLFAVKRKDCIKMQLPMYINLDLGHNARKPSSLYVEIPNGDTLICINVPASLRLKKNGNLKKKVARIIGVLDSYWNNDLLMQLRMMGCNVVTVKTDEAIMQSAYEEEVA